MVRSVEINLGFRQWWETITRHLKRHMHSVLWGIPIILARGRQRQEDFKFGANLGYTGRPCL